MTTLDLGNHHLILQSLVHLWRITVKAFLTRVCVRRHRGSLQHLNTALKPTFLTVTCSNVAAALHALPSGSLTLKYSTSSFSKSLCLKGQQHLWMAVFVNPACSAESLVFRGLETECTVDQPVSFELCLPLGQKYKFKVKRRAFVSCVIWKNTTLWEKAADVDTVRKLMTYMLMEKIKHVQLKSCKSRWSIRENGVYMFFYW